MTILALIPARGGSKRIPRKNLVDLGQFKLIEWAIKAAEQAKIFNHIAVSTEDAEIARFVHENHAMVQVIDRPEALAQDASPMLPVVNHAIEHQRQRGFLPDHVVLLQPTSPFRTAEDIRAAFELYKSSGGDALVSVTEPEDDLVFNLGHCDRMRAAKDVVVPNGAIYILWVGSLMTGIDWWNGVSYAYRMPKERSIDIDSMLDLEMARAVVRHNGAKPCVA